jgi:chloride channel protein, CIC family
VLEGTSAYRIAIVSLVGLSVGALSSLASLAFIDALFWLNNALLISAYSRIQYEAQPALLTAATVLVPVLGGLIVGQIVARFIAERRGLGPPDAILAVQTREPPPSLRSGIASTLAALVSLGCGASVGQYGPLVYLGTLMGSLAQRLDLQLRDLQGIAIACGVAAAISTAFNAPIAGLVFAHEVILRHYSLRAFAPVTVASATGYVIANVILERPPLFLVEFSGVQHGHEFVLFAIEGVLAAYLAASFMLLIAFAGRMAQRSRLPASLRPALAGLVLGLTALQLPEVLGVGKETLRFATIEGAFAADELAVLVAAKLAVTAICVGFGFVGGVFSPALLIGVMAGALFGLIWPQIVPLAHSGIVPYAICGMMAVTSPVIGAPLTTILIVFELTRNYDLTIAAMVSVVFSNLIAYRMFGRSLFDVQLAARGFDLSLGRDKAILGCKSITKNISQDYVTVGADETVRAATARLRELGRAEAVVLGPGQEFIGHIRLRDIMELSGEAAMRDAVDARSPVFSETTTLWEAMQAIGDFVGEAIPLVDGHGRIMGVVPEGAVVQGYMEAVHDLRREENAAA